MSIKIHAAFPVVYRVVLGYGCPARNYISQPPLHLGETILSPMAYGQNIPGKGI